MKMKKKLNDLINDLQKNYYCEERETDEFIIKLKDLIKKEFPQVDFIKDYCLINNFGFIFKIDDIKYDCRFWANSYGSYLGYWSIH